MTVEHDHDLHQRLDEVLEAAIAIVRADFGTIELRDPHSGELHVAAQRGFSRDFIMSFEVTGDQTTVTSARPAGAGLPAPHATPLSSRSGEPLGMLTTYFRSPYRPRKEECRLLDLLVRHLSDCIDDSRALRAAREELRQEQEARVRAEAAHRARDEFMTTLVHDDRGLRPAERTQRHVSNRTAATGS